VISLGMRIDTFCNARHDTPDQFETTVSFFTRYLSDQISKEKTTIGTARIVLVASGLSVLITFV
jgi:hypothetical protein